jgi:phosphohistidine phosphatase
MKTLTLMRHAMSSWEDAGIRDFDRPLNDKGRRAARVMGEALAGTAISFDHVLASPARRVVETIEGVEAGLGRPLEPAPLFEPRVYLASAYTLLELAQAFPDTAKRALIIGHNPGLEDLALLLTPPGGELRAAIEEKYPTATVAELRFNVERWAEVAEGSAALVRFTRPRDLDPSLGPDDPLDATA